MASGRPILGILALFFTAGAVLLMFLSLLGGANNHSPLNHIYFLELCAVRNGDSECGSSHPDFPFAPPDSRNFGTEVNIPHQFIGTSHYWLMSRFMFPFMIIGLFFATCSMILGLLAPCTRIGSYVSSLLAWLAWVFQVITTCLMTACFVQGRNHFNSNGQHASLGSKIFGFMWAAVACLTLATVFYCVGGASGRHDNGYSGRETRRRGFFTARRSSTRSRGSLSNGARKEAA